MSGRRGNIWCWRPVRGLVALGCAAVATAGLSGCYGSKYDPERFMQDTVEVAGEVALVAVVYTFYFFAGAGAPRMMVVAGNEGQWLPRDEGLAGTPREGEPVVNPSP